MSLKFAFPVDIEEIYSHLTDPEFLVDRNVALGEPLVLVDIMA